MLEEHSEFNSQHTFNFMKLLLSVSLDGGIVFLIWNFYQL